MSQATRLSLTPMRCKLGGKSDAVTRQVERGQRFQLERVDMVGTTMEKRAHQVLMVIGMCGQWQAEVGGCGYDTSLGVH